MQLTRYSLNAGKLIFTFQILLKLIVSHFEKNRNDRFNLNIANETTEEDLLEDVLLKRPERRQSEQELGVPRLHPPLLVLGLVPQLRQSFVIYTLVEVRVGGGGVRVEHRDDLQEPEL